MTAWFLENYLQSPLIELTFTSLNVQNLSCCLDRARTLPTRGLLSTRIVTYLISIPRLSSNLTTSARHTAVVEKYRSPDGIVLVYRSATVYVAATSVITVRQYSLKTTLTFSEGKRGDHVTVEQV